MLIPPAQPNTEFYSLDNLLLATATSWVPGDPAFNPAFPSKSWQGNGTFDFLDPVAGTFTSKTVPAAQDATNLIPGNYPVYMVAPTVATAIVGAIGQYAPIAPYLSSLSDASKLMQQLGGNSLEDDGASSINYGSETRRVWCFTVNGVKVCAATLIEEMNANGVGAPGSFSGTTWIPAQPIPVPANVTDWGLPYRALLPNEVLIPIPSITGFEWQVQRTDLTPSAAGSALTTTEDTQLAQVASDITAMKSLLSQIAKSLGVVGS